MGKCKCYRCRVKKGQGGEYGHFCKACHAVATDAGIAATLAQEREEHDAKFAVMNPPTGREPARQLLVLPREPTQAWSHPLVQHWIDEVGRPRGRTAATLSTATTSEH